MFSYSAVLFYVTVCAFYLTQRLESTIDSIQQRIDLPSSKYFKAPVLPPDIHRAQRTEADVGHSVLLIWKVIQQEPGWSCPTQLSYANCISLDFLCLRPLTHDLAPTPTPQYLVTAQLLSACSAMLEHRKEDLSKHSHGSLYIAYHWISYQIPSIKPYADLWQTIMCL